MGKASSIQIHFLIITRLDVCQTYAPCMYNDVAQELLYEKNKRNKGFKYFAYGVERVSMSLSRKKGI